MVLCNEVASQTLFALGYNQIRFSKLHDKLLEGVRINHQVFGKMAIVALNLFLKTRVEAFPPSAVQEALRYIEAPPALWVPLAQSLTTLKSQLREAQVSLGR